MRWIGAVSAAIVLGGVLAMPFGTGDRVAAADKKELVTTGKVTAIDQRPFRILVDCPTFTDAGLWNDLVRFDLSKCTITDRQTNMPGKLAVGQRVTVWFGPELTKSDPPIGWASKVFIEPAAPPARKN
jgi:hypothetical protein